MWSPALWPGRSPVFLGRISLVFDVTLVSLFRRDSCAPKDLVETSSGRRVDMRFQVDLDLHDPRPLRSPPPPGQHLSDRADHGAQVRGRMALAVVRPGPDSSDELAPDMFDQLPGCRGVERVGHHDQSVDPHILVLSDEGGGERTSGHRRHLEW